MRKGTSFKLDLEEKEYDGRKYNIGTYLAHDGLKSQDFSCAPEKEFYRRAVHFAAGSILSRQGLRNVIFILTSLGALPHEALK